MDNRTQIKAARKRKDKDGVKLRTEENEGRGKTKERRKFCKERRKEWNKQTRESRKGWKERELKKRKQCERLLHAECRRKYDMVHNLRISQYRPTQVQFKIVFQNCIACSKMNFIHTVLQITHSEYYGK
jgi:hypothetical protein